jgi:hypothetical protein
VERSGESGEAKSRQTGVDDGVLGPEDGLPVEDGRARDVEVRLLLDGVPLNLSLHEITLKHTWAITADARLVGAHSEARAVDAAEVKLRLGVRLQAKGAADC